MGELFKNANILTTNMFYPVYIMTWIYIYYENYFPLFSQFLKEKMILYNKINITVI